MLVVIQLKKPGPISVISSHKRNYKNFFLGNYSELGTYLWSSYISKIESILLCKVSIQTEAIDEKNWSKSLSVEDLSLKVSFLVMSVHKNEVNSHKILHSFWSIFKFGFIFKLWDDEKRKTSKLGSSLTLFIFLLFLEIFS